MPNFHLVIYDWNELFSFLNREAAELFNSTAVAEFREELHNDIWLANKADVHDSGSKDVIGGPTFAMAIYLDVLNRYSDRFVTGTDFVASYGSKEKYPGLKKFKDPPSGCVKDRANHARYLLEGFLIALPERINDSIHTAKIND